MGLVYNIYHIDQVHLIISDAAPSLTVSNSKPAFPLQRRADSFLVNWHTRDIYIYIERDDGIKITALHYSLQTKEFDRSFPLSNSNTFLLSIRREPFSSEYNMKPQRFLLISSIFFAILFLSNTSPASSQQGKQINRYLKDILSLSSCAN